VILGTIKRDEKQRNTFEQLGFRLIRVTDKQFKAMTLDELRESVVGSNNQERKII
jgi:G:T-mismatch repair DNA endonuclease (very short patch repair protein)